MAVYETIKIRRDSTLNWYASNPRLELGELGIDMDLHRMKAGNGIDRWNQLPYLNDDAYALLNSLGQNLTDTAQDIRHVIENNKLDADQRIADMRQDFRTRDASLTLRMKTVEDRQTSYEGNLTNRQDEYESGLTLRQEGYESEITGRQDEYENEVSEIVSGMRSELDSGLEDFDQTKANLTTRMDAIAGQATEDTEILDARVDAEYETHPNLGHNIRSLHTKVLAQDTEHSAKTAELWSYIKNSESEQAHKNEELQAYSEELADYEARQRKNSDEHIYGLSSDAGEGILQTNLTLSHEIQKRKEADSALSERISENTANINSEREINSQRQRENSARLDDLNAECKTLHEADDVLIRGLDDVSQAVMQTAVTIQEGLQELKDGDIVSWNEDILPDINAATHNGVYGEGNKQFAMLCLADVHSASSRMNAGIKYLNAIDAIDCGCCLGDLQNGFANEFGTWYEDAVNRSSKPFYTVLGNHEMGPGGTRAKGATADAVFNRYMKPVIAKTGLTGITKGYYRADWNKYGISLIVLNGYCAPENTDGNGNFIYTNVSPYFGQEQINWLINELETIPAGNSLIVMLHMQDFRITAEDDSFTQASRIGKTYGGDSYPYGTNGILQDIIEAWRTGSEFEHEYIPKDKSGVTESISVQCDYRERGEGDFICWLTGHHHVDIIGRSVKYPAQLVIHVCSTVGGSRAQNADLPRVKGTRSEDAITVLVADKLSRQIKLIRVGSNVTLNMTERRQTSLNWDYEVPEHEITAPEVEQKLYEEIAVEVANREISESRLRENDEYLYHELSEVSEGLLRTQVNTQSALNSERLEREANDKVLRETNSETISRVNEISEGLIQTELNVHDWLKKEQNQRESSDERLSEQIEHGLAVEEAERKATDLNLQATDAAINQELERITLGLEDILRGLQSAESEIQRERTERESAGRIAQEANSDMYRLIEDISQGMIETELTLHSESEKRRLESAERQEQAERLRRELEQERTADIELMRQEDARIESYTEHETQDRQKTDGILQAQINALSEAIIQNLIEQRQMREVLRDWVQAANVLYEMAAETGNLTYRGARIASGDAITTMLSDVLSGTDTGEVSESEIPEELRDQITTSEEMNEMLSEIFSH